MKMCTTVTTVTAAVVMRLLLLVSSDNFQLQDHSFIIYFISDAQKLLLLAIILSLIVLCTVGLVIVQ